MAHSGKLFKLALLATQIETAFGTATQLALKWPIMFQTKAGQQVFYLVTLIFASSGLDMPPAGYRGTNGGYYDRSTSAVLWSSTAGGAGALGAAACTMTAVPSSAYDYAKAYGFSVRCLKD